MKSVRCKDGTEIHDLHSKLTNGQDVTDSLINGNSKSLENCRKPNGLKIPPMSPKLQFSNAAVLKSSNGYDVRCQSMPNCLDDQNGIHSNQNNITESCDTDSNLLTKTRHQESPQNSPTSDLWFKTWPDRYDKLKTNDSSLDLETSDSPNSRKCNTQTNAKNCDIVDSKINKITLNEALQNISLAYSPVTKQLHLVEQLQEPIQKENDIKPDNKILEESSDEVDCAVVVKSKHKRTEAGSFSSTVSTLSGISDPSTCGSLLDADDRSISSFDECSSSKKRTFSNFFSRNVFSWRPGKDEKLSGTSVWKIFGKTSTEDSPLHLVASSSALIQHGRPSNLPAKTLEEEQRHREEYRAMIAAAKKKEAQNTAAKQKREKFQLQLEEQQAASAKHFTQNVLGSWDVMKKSKKTQDLWWQGLPSSIRGKIWRLAIGNELNVTPQLYEICLSRAQNRLNSPEPSHCESDFDQESSMDVIQLDISRTFPNLCIFQEGGPYSDILHSLLAAYVCYRPDVGYVQGMSYIAAILILNMEQFDAFICFANLLNQPLHLSAFTLNQTQMQAYYSAYNQVFSYNLPKLHSHFLKSGLTPDLYLLDWIYTIFAKAMPLDVACRVWDVFLRDGYEFIFRTALGILHLHQDMLLQMDFLHGAQFLTRLPEDMSSDQLFRSIQSVTTNIGKQSFGQIVDKCVSNGGTFS